MSENSPQMIGRFQLLAKLATGGMAEIYLARQTGIGGFEKLVVVKRILPHLASEEAFVEMFLDEAVIAAQLNHPNVVQIYDLGKAEEDYFIAMEFLEGESLGYLVSEGHKAHNPLPPELAAGIIAEVATGLYYAHTFEDDSGQPLNIVHRDVSPHNIIVLFSGGVKLVDFGIAKAATKMHHTRVGTIKGKLAYMAPEQCLGKKVDGRSDLFSLGVVLWELLARKRLFKRDSEPAMIRAIVDEDIPKVRDVRPEVPAALADVADCALAKEPDERYRNAAEMAQALRDYLAQDGHRAGPQEIAEYATAVFGDRARTKKKILQEIEEGGASGVSLREMKPKSDSLPSQSLVSQQGKVDAAPAPSPEALAAAVEPTRIREEEAEEPAVDPAAVAPTHLMPAVTDDDLPATPKKGGGLKIVIPLVLIIVLGLGAYLFMNMGGEPSPDSNAGPTPLKPANGLDGTKDDGSAADHAAPAAADAGAPDEAKPDEAKPDEGKPDEAKPDEGKPDEGKSDTAKPDTAKPDTAKPKPGGDKPKGDKVAHAVTPKPKPKPRPRTHTRPKPKPKPKGEGKLKLNTKPWSEIFLGKKKLGMTPLLGLDLPAGRHTLTAVNEGRGIRKTIKVTIKPGETTTLKVNLLK